MFTRMKPSSHIIANLKVLGYSLTVNSVYNKNDNTFTFLIFFNESHHIFISSSTCSFSIFNVISGNIIATNDSTEFDSEEWFVNVFNSIYEDIEISLAGEIKESEKYV